MAFALAVALYVLVLRLLAPKFPVPISMSLIKEVSLEAPSVLRLSLLVESRHIPTCLHFSTLVKLTQTTPRSYDLRLMIMDCTGEKLVTRDEQRIVVGVI